MNLAIKDNSAEYFRLLNQRASLSRQTPAWVIKMNLKELSFALVAELQRITAPAGGYRNWNLAQMKSGRGLKIPPGVYEGVIKKYKMVRLEDGKLRFAKTKKRTGETTLSGRYLFGRKRVKNEQGKSVLVGGKWLNIQQLAVERELNRREQARGFMAHTAMVGVKAGRTVPLMGRAHVVQEQSAKVKRENISSIDWEATNGAAYATFNWGSNVSKISEKAAEGMHKGKLQQALHAAMASQSVILRAKIDKELKKRMGVK